MRRSFAGTSNCASVLTAALIAVFVTVSLASDVALSDSSGSDASLSAAPPVPPCGSNEPTDPSNASPGSEPACADAPRTPEDVAEARAYLVETASPGYTMTLQGPELAIGRLHPQFAVRLEHAIREARSAGLPFAAVFSAYRPPAFGVGGFSDKFNSLHTYGLAVDMRGIGSPGSSEAQLWHQIAARNGVVCPYGPRDRAEWNHCQPTSVKMILAANPLRETVTPTGPSDLECREIRAACKGGAHCHHIVGTPENGAHRREVIAVREGKAHRRKIGTAGKGRACRRKIGGARKGRACGRQNGAMQSLVSAKEEDGRSAPRRATRNQNPGARRLESEMPRLSCLDIGYPDAMRDNFRPLWSMSDQMDFQKTTREPPRLA